LILCSTERAQVEQGWERIRRRNGNSLADSESYTAARKEHDGALAFAFVDGPRLLTHLTPHLTGEAAAARLALDLDHLARIVVAVTTDEQGASAQARVTYQEGHHSLAYGLVRTEPFGTQALSQVPEGAALVAVVGVNPSREESQSQRDGAMYLTGLDIGRELFANIAEVSVFVLPSKVASSQDAPDFGLVVASNDAGKSDALWNQLLSLPASLGMKDGPEVAETMIEGKHARTYKFDKHAPAIMLTRWNADTLVAGTPRAVTQLAESSKQGRSALNDPAFANRIKNRGEHTSKAVFANIGRMLELASQLERNERKAAEMKALRKVLSDLTLTWSSNETPTELTISARASGLPLFEDIVRIVAGQQAEKSSSRVASTESNSP
jgi:hypothetical protein